MKNDELDEIQLDLSSEQVEALLQQIQSCLSDGSERAVRAAVITKKSEPGCITYEIVTAK